MSRVRVVLADLSPLLRGLIGELIADPEVELIDLPPGADLDEVLRASGAEVVILPGDGHAMSPAARRLLDDRARLRVISIVDHARAAVLGGLTVREVPIGDLSISVLLDVVRRPSGSDAAQRGAVS